MFSKKVVRRLSACVTLEGGNRTALVRIRLQIPYLHRSVQSGCAILVLRVPFPTLPSLHLLFYLSDTKRFRRFFKLSVLALCPTLKTPHDEILNRQRSTPGCPGELPLKERNNPFFACCLAHPFQPTCPADIMVSFTLVVDGWHCQGAFPAVGNRLDSMGIDPQLGLLWCTNAPQKTLATDFRLSTPSIGWYSRHKRSLCRAEKASDYRCRAGGKPIGGVHGRTHFWYVVWEHSLLLTHSGLGKGPHTHWE